MVGIKVHEVKRKPAFEIFDLCQNATNFRILFFTTLLYILLNVAVRKMKIYVLMQSFYRA